VVDLTYAAAKKLDFISAGLTKVKVVVLNKKLRK
jgi:rare lipoprotein A (peptidoglycan hydrolase)